MKMAKTDSHYIINVSTDKEGIVNVPAQLGIYESKRDAKKAMMNQASKDLVEGNYYFYHLIEKKSIRHETYPSIEESK